MQEYDEVRLPVRNRGFNRVGLAAAPENPSRADVERSSEPQIFWGSREQHPWNRLLWWESELHAAKGIGELASRPFLILPEEWSTDFPPQVALRTSTLYRGAVKSHEKRRIRESAEYVAALVRQAHEFYVAADSAGVSELSRPVLYYYGALALAKAATAAIFGRNKSEERNHGLTFGKNYGRSVCKSNPGWPTVIELMANGVFVRLYRVTRWDADLYCSSNAESHWKEWEKHDKGSLPKFHILECLRWLQCDWGLLPKTGFEWDWPVVPKRSDREKCLLQYTGPDDIFLKKETPLDRSLFQLPVITVQYMVLYYFSILARYYGLEWQRLLAGSHDPEGYVFRRALEEVSQDFLLSILDLLPRQGDRAVRSLPSTLPRFLRKPPSLQKWYRHPVERVSRQTAI